MNPAQFDDIRRLFRVSLQGQHLTPAQVDELKDIAAERVDLGLLTHRFINNNRLVVINKTRAQGPSGPTA